MTHLRYKVTVFCKVVQLKSSNQAVRSTIACAFVTATGAVSLAPFACAILECCAFELNAPKLDPEVLELEPEDPF